jgi:hypothetical protein
MNGRNRKRGRPVIPVEFPKGSTIEGLSYWAKGNGVYHVTGRRDIRFGSDLASAVAQFRVWEAEQGGREIALEEEKDATSHLVKLGEKLKAKDAPPIVAKLRDEFKARDISVDQLIKDATGKTFTKRHQLNEATFLAEVARWMRDPLLRHKMTQATGYPFDRLETLPALGKTIAKATALKNWEGKLKKVSDGERSQVKWAWEDFAKHVKAATLREVTREDVRAWVASVYTTYSPKMARNRVMRIKAVLRYNMKEEKDPTSCDRIIRWLSSSETPSATLLNPQPIKRD